MRDLPVPGGPVSKMDLLGLIPTFSKSCGFVNGSSIASRINWSSSPSPPTSAKVGPDFPPSSELNLNT